MTERERGTDDRGDGAAPVFIVGSGRSGNTLLRRLMMATGTIYIPPETYVVADIIRLWPRLCLLEWKQKVWLFCAQFERHRHFETFGVASLDAFAREMVDVPRDQRRLRTLFDAFYRHLAAANDSPAPRWGDKTPFNAFGLREIARTFPDARFVYLARDGRDVVASYLEAGLYDAPEAAAMRWVRATRHCERMLARRPARMRKLRYEDIVRAPETVLGPLFQWLDLPYDSALARRDPGRLGDVERLRHHAQTKQPISPASIGRWRTRLDDAALAALPAEFWRTMREQGYLASREEEREPGIALQRRPG